ncbi:RNA polymerase sigma-70 factor, ECF subfamily [Pelolinea submarina]|nr:RNA polymerase sigma-70 factor, ECF subfamily [Pelolinea submarina]
MYMKTDGHTHQSAASKIEPDALLLEQIAGGDEGALEALFERCGDRLYAYILGMLHDESTAQDVLQETLIAIWKQAGSYRGEGRVVAWAYGIARNKTLHAYRVRENLPLDEQAENTAQTNDGDPERQAQLQQRREILRQGLNALAPQYREVLDLFFLHDMKLQEIAAICKIPLGTVKSRLNHARRELKNTLARQGQRMEDLI